MATTVIRGIFFRYNPRPGQVRTDWIPRFGFTPCSTTAFGVIPPDSRSLNLYWQSTDYDGDGKLVGAKYASGAIPLTYGASVATFTASSSFLMSSTVESDRMILSAPTIQAPSYSLSYSNGAPAVDVAFQKGVGDSVPYETALANYYPLNIGTPTLSYQDATFVPLGSWSFQQGFIQDPGTYVDYYGNTYDESIIFAPSLSSCQYRITRPPVVVGISYEAYYTAGTGDFLITKVEKTMDSGYTAVETMTASPFTTINQ